MMGPNDPGDFGKPLLNITKKLRAQNFWLKIAVGALSVTTFLLWLNNLKNKKPDWKIAENERDTKLLTEREDSTTKGRAGSGSE